MIFADIPAGAAVFLDANTLVYHFAGDAQYGPACTQLMKRIELRQLQGSISAHVLADVAHRLMTIEALRQFGWPVAGLAARLRKHRAEIAKLTIYRQAVTDISKYVQVLSVTQSLVEAATALSGQYELLTGDALIVAVMQANGLTHLASNDGDFDRVAGITRYGPG